MIRDDLIVKEQKEFFSMATHKIVTFGEIMLRLSTPGFSRFVQAQQFDINYGGGEANVAASVSAFCSRGICAWAYGWRRSAAHGMWIR